MNIAVFPARNVEEINAFIDAHDIVQKDNEHRIEIHGDDMFIFYWPELTNEQYEQKLVEARLRSAEQDLVKFKVHARFLDAMKMTDHSKYLDMKMENSKAIDNAQAAVDLFKNWGKEPLAAEPAVELGSPKNSKRRGQPGAH